MMRRLLPLVLLFLGIAAPANAQIVRTFTPRYTINAPGDKYEQEAA